MVKRIEEERPKPKSTSCVERKPVDFNQGAMLVHSNMQAVADK